MARVNSRLFESKWSGGTGAPADLRSPVSIMFRYLSIDSPGFLVTGFRVTRRGAWGALPPGGISSQLLLYQHRVTIAGRNRVNIIPDKWSPGPGGASISDREAFRIE